MYGLPTIQQFLRRQRLDAMLTRAIIERFRARMNAQYQIENSDIIPVLGAELEGYLGRLCARCPDFTALHRHTMLGHIPPEALPFVRDYSTVTTLHPEKQPYFVLSEPLPSQLGRTHGKIMHNGFSFLFVVDDAAPPGIVLCARYEALLHREADDATERANACLAETLTSTVQLLATNEQRAQYLLSEQTRLSELLESGTIELYAPRHHALTQVQLLLDELGQ